MASGVAIFCRRVRSAALELERVDLVGDALLLAHLQQHVPEVADVDAAGELARAAELLELCNLGTHVPHALRRVGEHVDADLVAEALVLQEITRGHARANGGEALLE